MEARIIFEDGTELTAEKNGDCFITEQKPEFPEELGHVIAESEENTREWENAKLIECASNDGNYWFSFTEIPEEDMEKAAMRAEIDMLTECILEMSEVVYGE